ncbi:MAG: GNAT family N-acetyltransferase [Anaerolineae bacterium]|nr:GNAT family N-acetyltransferase [Anaerolineae bacterium]
MLNETSQNVPGVEITAATWRDLNELRAVEHDCFDHDAWSLIDLIGVLTLPGTSRLKAVVNGRMVGFAAGDIRKDEATGWISTIGVIGAYRRLGIGSRLLNASEKDMAMPRVCLCVRKSNQPAIQLYTRHGYHVFDHWERYYEDGEEALVMEKYLRSQRIKIETA